MRAITSRSRPLGVLLLVALALASGVLSTSTAHAVPRVGSDQVRVTAGWDGRARPGRLLPVQVFLTGPAAASPTVDVQVRSGNGGTTITRTAVAPGPGGAARATMAVSAPRDLQSFEVVVTARHGSTTDTGKASVEPVKDEELVGVLPDLARRSTPPVTEPLSVPIGTARFVTVDLDTMSVVGSLGPLGTVATTGSQLAGLTSTQSLNLRSWLAAGGRLLVDETDGPVPGLPPPWQVSTSNPRASAGLGEVRLTGGFLAAGGWAGAIEPTPTVSPADPDVVTSTFAGGPVSQALARNSGLRIPSLGVVLGFLLGYVLLAGPITFFILHKLHRAELAWVAVPLLAVGFTVGGWVIGGSARDNTRTGYSASVLETDGADLNLSYVGVLSRQGGDRSVTFPGGWWGGNVANELYGPAEAPVTATVRPGGTNAQVSLVGGEFAVLSGRGPTTPTSQLQVQAAAGPDSNVTGTVQNQTSQTLRQVAVFIGSRSVLVGDVPPHASRPYTVAAPPATSKESDVKDPARSPFAAPEAKVWPSVATQTVDQRSGPVDLALWGETTRLLGPDLRTPGVAVAVGWADRLRPPGTIGAGAEGRTAVIARSPVDPGAALAGIAIRRDLLRGPSGTTISDPSGPATGATFRFVLPAGKTGLDPLGLQLSVPATLSRVDVWDGTRWVTVYGSDGTNGTTSLNGNSPTPVPVVPAFDSPPTLVELPQGSVIGGTVHVRVAVLFNGPSNSTGELLLQGRS